MSEFYPARGTVAKLRIKNSTIPHIHVVLTNPIFDEQSGKLSVLLVNLTSERNRDGDLKYDPTCELKKGDDPLITKDCFVLYAKAQIISVRQLEAWIRRDKAAIERMGSYAFGKICEGLESSPPKPFECWLFYLNARHSNAAD